MNTSTRLRSRVSDRLHVAIEVESGGLAVDAIGALKAPFVNRKPHGIGDTLGLFVASRLVAEIDGELVLVARPSATRVELRLPRA